MGFKLWQSCLSSFNATLLCLLALLLTPFSSHPPLLTCCFSMSTIAFDLPHALLMFLCTTSFWCAFCHVPLLVWFVSASVVPNEAKVIPPLFFVSQINCVFDKVSFSKVAFLLLSPSSAFPGDQNHTFPN